MSAVPAIERVLTNAAWRADRIRRELGYEIRRARLRAGLGQVEVGHRARCSASKVSRLETGRLARLTIDDAARVAAVVGLDLTARVYPGEEPIRDAAQSRRLLAFLRRVGPPLRWRADVPLPQQPGRSRELRAWDAVVEDDTERTAIELESRLSDVQEVTRRHALKRRDDVVHNFLLIVADTPHNRRVVSEFGALLDLPRLRTANVLKTLTAGRHPPTGMILF